MNTEIPSNPIGGKAQNLNLLSEYAHASLLYKVPEFYSVVETEDFDAIRHRLVPGRKYAVRSSGISEDSHENSMAGQFKTHLHVDIQDIPAAIKDIKSHSGNRTGEYIPVVIQEMVEDIEISGIAFSHDVDTDKPYTVVQTHNGIGEELVSGNINGETWKILNNLESDDIEVNVPKNLRTIYSSVQELRSKYPTKYFDIEFAVDTKGQLFLLQIRPLTTVNRETKEVLPLTLRYARRITHGLKTSGKVYGDMIDINPRELVGGEPMIIQTMFQYLFADRAIPETRKEMGYKVSENKLTTSICGDLYISLEEDLRAFLPDTLPEEDVRKFIRYYENLLKHSPDAQSRLDSELYPITRERALDVICDIYDDTGEQERVLGFFTQLFDHLEGFLSNKFLEYKELEIGLLAELGVNSYFDLIKAKELPIEDIDSLTQLATRIAKQFAFFARGAFYYSQFQTSNPRLFASHLYQKDIFESLAIQGIDEIGFHQIEGFNLLRTFETHFSSAHRPVYLDSAVVNDNNTEVNKVELFLAARENLKFILMRVLFFLGRALSRENIENVDNLDFGSLITGKRKFHKGDNRQRVGTQIIFPGVLAPDSTPIAHKVSDESGYFIGNGTLEEESVYIPDVSQLAERIADVTGKILIIDHATPEIDGALGYVKGIVTRVGGPLAHIAIRAREMRIPSVVGIGDKFDKIKLGKTVSINFDKQKIHAA